jgi:dihydrofolate synthase/folylpolyglutamate synthase
MTHEEALAWWFAHANYEQRTPTADDLKLGRMRTLLARLGEPHRKLRILHVAGSKGKGSTSAMLASVLREAGYRVGLFTSPHLTRLEERFQVDGQPINPGELTQLLSEIREVVDAAPTTFFEIATAVGLMHFVRRRVDAAVLEVGLGGRLDSTNVCLPVLSVITSISFDHTRILGDKLAMIGRVTRTGLVKLRVQVTTASRPWPAFEVNLLGEHQASNAAVVIACIEQLTRAGWHISDDAVSRGLANVHWQARMEVLCQAPLVVLDCAHNVASAEALVETLTTSFPPGRRTLVFAGSGDKDVAGMFRVPALALTAP